MIRTIFRFAFLTVALGGWGLAALSLHVVRTPDRIGLIPKERLGFTDTYVDARSWKLADLSNHPELVKRVLEADKADLFAYLTDSSKGDATSQISGMFGRGTGPQDVVSTVKALFGAQAHAAAMDSMKLPVDF